MNKVQIMGYLGNDPIINDISQNRRMAKFRLANTEFWQDKDGNQCRHTNWFDVTVFNEYLLNQKIPHLQKGSRIFLEGLLRQKILTNNDNNEVKNYIEIVLQNGCRLYEINKPDDVKISDESQVEEKENHYGF